MRGAGWARLNTQVPDACKNAQVQKYQPEYTSPYLERVWWLGGKGIGAMACRHLCGVRKPTKHSPRAHRARK